MRSVPLLFKDGERRANKWLFLQSPGIVPFIVTVEGLCQPVHSTILAYLHRLYWHPIRFSCLPELRLPYGDARLFLRLGWSGFLRWVFFLNLPTSEFFVQEPLELLFPYFSDLDGLPQNPSVSTLPLRNHSNVEVMPWLAEWLSFFPCNLSSFSYLASAFAFHAFATTLYGCCYQPLQLPVGKENVDCSRGAVSLLVSKGFHWSMTGSLGHPPARPVLRAPSFFRSLRSELIDF